MMAFMVDSKLAGFSRFELLGKEHSPWKWLAWLQRWWAWPWIRSHGLAMWGCTIIHQQRVGPTWPAFWHMLPDLPWLVIECLDFCWLVGLVSCLGHNPWAYALSIYVVDAPVPCFLANLFVFWFVVHGWHLLPFFVLLLYALVSADLAILVIIPCILICVSWHMWEDFHVFFTHTLTVVLSVLKMIMW